MRWTEGSQAFPESLIDLASVLTSDPANADANREFALVEPICQEEQRLMNSEEVVDADFPPAFGAETRTAEQLPIPPDSALVDTFPPQRGPSS